MQNLLLRLPIFIMVLLNATHAVPMISSEKASESQFHIPAFLVQRLKERPLLLDSPPFDFVQLIPELQLYVASSATPQTMSNLSITCTSLHEKLTFQTPGIWNIVTHSLNAISEKKLPELLVKAYLCQEHATERSHKLFYHTIQKKIESFYDIKIKNPYYYLNRHRECVYFNPFAYHYSYHLIPACYTGDTNIVRDTLERNPSFGLSDVEKLIFITINGEKTNILPLICRSYAYYLEETLHACKFNSEPGKESFSLDWAIFIPNNAITLHKKKSFESLIAHYKQYLNMMDVHNRCYLDFLINKFGNKENNAWYNKDYREYATIVMKYGGTGSKETIKAILEED